MAAGSNSDVHRGGLRAAVEAGILRLDPGAAERAAQVCEDQAARFEARIQRLEQAGGQLALGDSLAGRQLSTAFARKIHGGDGAEGVVDALARGKRIMQNMAATYRAAGAAYQDTEDATAESLRRTQSDSRP